MPRASMIAAVMVGAALAIGLGSVNAQSCNMSFTQPTSRYGATYDLSALMNRSPLPSPSGKCGAGAWFSEDDSDPEGESVDFYYCYNFCVNLPTSPPTTPAGVCSSTQQPVGGFWQVSNSTKTGLDVSCHVLAQATNVSWAMLDPLNPAIGVVQVYGNGDLCGSQGPRQMTVQFRCARYGGEPAFSTVSEDNVCDYSLVVNSIHACPTECPVVNEQLCNGHGVCGGDDDLGLVRCFCNSGYSGADCATAVGPVTPVDDGGGSSGSNATSVLIAFVIILTIALLAMAVVLWRKIKRLNADDSRYGQLTDDGAKDAPRRPPTGVSMGAAAATVSGGGAAAASDTRDHGAAHQLAAAVSTNV